MPGGGIAGAGSRHKPIDARVQGQLPSASDLAGGGPHSRVEPRWVLRRARAKNSTHARGLAMS
eukprot:13762172-Alexandrium_andersonii.AAC.1